MRTALGYTERPRFYINVRLLVSEATIYQEKPPVMYVMTDLEVITQSRLPKVRLMVKMATTERLRSDRAKG